MTIRYVQAAWVCGLVVVAAVAVASAALGSPSPGKSGNYNGTAKSLVLTPKGAKYKKITESKPAVPSAAKRAGIKSAWEVTYLDPIPVSLANVLIYVYDNPRHALIAYQNACKGCKHKTVKGVEYKYVYTRVKSIPVVTTGAHCRNVYVAASTSGTSETPSQLAYNAGFLIGAIYAKARVYGMGPCGAAVGVGSTTSKTNVRAAPQPSPHLWRGQGARVLTTRLPRGEPLVVTSTHNGSSNFVVKLVGGGANELLVNTIGAYAGQVVWADAKRGKFRIAIQADGVWKVNLFQPTAATAKKNLIGRFSGTGSRALFLRATTSLQPVLTASHTGKSNFVVRLIGYGNVTGTAILINEIGNYRGQVLLDQAVPRGTYVAAVEADGAWTLKFAP